MDQTIQFIDQRLAHLRALIPVYKLRPALEKWLASEIMVWQIRRNEYLHYHPTPIPQHPLIPATLSVQRQPQLKSLKSVINPSAILNEMPLYRIERPQQTANSRTYWQPNQMVGAPARYLRQIRYLPLPNALPDLDKALCAAWLDCGQDLHKHLGEFGDAVNVWVTVHVAYESVKPMTNKTPFVMRNLSGTSRVFDLPVYCNLFLKW